MKKICNKINTLFEKDKSEDKEKDGRDLFNLDFTKTKNKKMPSFRVKLDNFVRIELITFSGQNYIHFIRMDYENPEKIKSRFNINIDNIENLIQSLIALKNVI